MYKIIGIWIGGVSRHFQQYFNYIMATSFIGGGSRREPPTLGKQLGNLSLAAASRVHHFCNLQSWVRTHAILVIGLNALLNQDHRQCQPDRQCWFITSTFLNVFT